ncbi:hypothetical protein Fmac_008481 [Flemingia macrophylla]|uniref:ENTH domain-containing protein n=1 Tax=Flemingia macrophylla TaxID=520843 RepID=A0ABD1MXH4_9FABA
MGTFQSFRKAYGALKDSTKVGLAKVNSEYKKYSMPHQHTNHGQMWHIAFTNFPRDFPRREVAVKTLIVIHRTLREGDPTFREELLNYSRRGHILQISNFKDDSSPLAWDCSAWVRTYALFLEERLECFRVLKYDIESERLTKSSSTTNKAHSRTRSLANDDLLEQLPALQQLLYRLIGCQPPPSFLATMEEYIKEAPQTGFVNKKLVRENDVQVPRSKLEYQENDESPKEDSESNEPEEPKENEEQAEEVNEESSVSEEETQAKKEKVESPPLISTDDATDDLLGLNEINPKAMEMEDNNAMALAIVPPGEINPNNLALSNISGTNGWELALVSTPSNHTSQAIDRNMAGGFDKLLLDSLYEDENARRQLQLQNAGYGHGEAMAIHNPFDHYNNQHDPFAMSKNIAPPPNVQMAQMAQQQQQQQMTFQQQQMMYQPQQQHHMMMVPHQQQPYNQYSQQMQVSGSHNPFGDPLPVPNYHHSSTPQQGNYNLI